MSQSKNLHEAQRWLNTAIEDMQAALVLQERNLFSHACFQAQQCAEKALKAMWYLLDQDPWGHSVQRLVKEYPNLAHLLEPEDWLQRAALLDRYYIPTRYPNGLPDLTPGESYFAEDARQAIEQAQFFLSAARQLIAEK
jgi:HEPN domain-containing protein